MDVGSRSSFDPEPVVSQPERGVPCGGGGPGGSFPPGRGPGTPDGARAPTAAGAASVPTRFCSGSGFLLSFRLGTRSSYWRAMHGRLARGMFSSSVVLAVMTLSSTPSATDRTNVVPSNTNSPPALEPQNPGTPRSRA